MYKANFIVDLCLPFFLLIQFSKLVFQPGFCFFSNSFLFLNLVERAADDLYSPQLSQTFCTAFLNSSLSVTGTLLL